MALNNFVKELIFEIKQLISFKKTTANNHIYQYRTSWKEQIESVKQNVPTKYKYLAPTSDNTGLHNIKKSNNSDHDENDNNTDNRKENIIGSLHNNPISKDNTNDNTEHINIDNNSNISKVGNSNSISAINPNKSNQKNFKS